MELTLSHRVLSRSRNDLFSLGPGKTCRVLADQLLHAVPDGRSKRLIGHHDPPLGIEQYQPFGQGIERCVHTLWHNSDRIVLSQHLFEVVPKQNSCPDHTEDAECQ